HDDAGPVPVQCTPSSGSTFPLGETLVTCTATNPADNPSTITTSFRVKVIDSKPPVRVSCEKADGLWHAANVTLTCLYRDVDDGEMTLSLATSVALGEVKTSAPASAAGAQACDAAGNCAKSPANIGGNKIDLKQPNITVLAPKNGKAYVLNSHVAASYK